MRRIIDLRRAGDPYGWQWRVVGSGPFSKPPRANGEYWTNGAGMGLSWRPAGFEEEFEIYPAGEAFCKFELPWGPAKRVGERLAWYLSRRGGGSGPPYIKKLRFAE